MKQYRVKQWESKNLKDWKAKHTRDAIIQINNSSAS